VLKEQPVLTDKGAAAAFSSVVADLQVGRFPYQGISFFRPFFLLLDSF
jgi:hypothetical protein